MIRPFLTDRQILPRAAADDHTLVAGGGARHPCGVLVHDARDSPRSARPATIAAVRLPSRPAHLLAVVALAGSLAACTASGGGSGSEASAGADASTTTTAATSASGPLDAEGALAAIAPSMALISTPDATGSAVLVDGGYLVTNAHVVDPWAEVDVTFAGEERIEGVPVSEVDLVADLALVGPVDADLDAEPLEIVAPEGVADAGDAFLVGFPGEQDIDDPTARVSDGELLGLLPDERWDLAYVRSTTPIRDGQSGGALVDAQGRVVGISSMSDEDGTALSVAGGDVAESVAALRDHDGSDWDPIHLDDATTDDTARPLYDGAIDSWYVPSSWEGTELIVTVDGPEPKVAVGVPGDATYPWATSSSIDPDDTGDAWYVDDAEALEPAGEGAWRIPLVDGEPAVVTVAVAAGTDAYDVTFSEPVLHIDVEGPTTGLVVGSPRRLTIASLEDDAYFSVDLEAGTTYEIAARSPSSDVFWTIEHVDDPDDWTEGDDGGGGIFDYDAVESFTPERGGEYLLFVTDAGDAPSEVEVEITEA